MNHTSAALFTCRLNVGIWRERGIRHGRRRRFHVVTVQGRLLHHRLGILHACVRARAASHRGTIIKSAPHRIIRHTGRQAAFAGHRNICFFQKNSPALPSLAPASPFPPHLYKHVPMTRIMFDDRTTALSTVYNRDQTSTPSHVQ